MSGWELADSPDSWDVSIPTDDASIERRVKALAPPDVLNTLDRDKTRNDGDFWAHYHLAYIAVAVIDQVALAMGISAGRTWDETMQFAMAEAARQRPEASKAEWFRVAERVITTLVTAEVETVPYLSHASGEPTWKAQRFLILSLHKSGADGAEHLRASDQAINSYLTALDIDIEHAQIANEAAMKALIDRGAIASATQLAQMARHQSAQYLEQTRRIVADTLLDPDAHDWVDAVPEMLNHALAHVGDRLQAEGVLEAVLKEQREKAESIEKVDQANDLIERLRDCRHRHNELHRHLMGARTRHRDALNDRLARPPRTEHRVDVASELLIPYLQLPTSASAEIAERVVAIVAGLRARWLPDLDTATSDLCASARQTPEGAQFDPAEFEPDDDISDWWEPYEQIVAALLDELTEPTRLSQVLARLEDPASTFDDETAEPRDRTLLTATAVHAAHRAWATHLAGRMTGDRLVMAVDDGEQIRTRTITSADLLLVPAEVTSDIVEHHPAASTTSIPPPSASSRNSDLEELVS